VCRSAYIHPKVLEAFNEGHLAEAFAGIDGEEAFETAALRFLSEAAADAPLDARA
jgi:hypothetical protein